VFADVAPYYDQANVVASLGMWDFLLRSFMDTMELRAGERALDVCAGTNAVGIALQARAGPRYTPWTAAPDAGSRPAPARARMRILA
jgi:ubiquinone/menaquinone biosynthesis C-methylase UbiE